jgi:hypothetical protein
MAVGGDSVIMPGSMVRYGNRVKNIHTYIQGMPKCEYFMHIEAHFGALKELRELQRIGN